MQYVIRENWITETGTSAKLVGPFYFIFAGKGFLQQTREIAKAKKFTTIQLAKKAMFMFYGQAARGGGRVEILTV